MKKEEKKPRFQVHVYSINNNPQCYYYDDQDTAISFGQLLFATKEDIYKVKVWDTEKGAIEPNKPNAAALIKEFV